MQKSDSKARKRFKKRGGRSATSRTGVAKRLWEALNTPVSLSCYLLCKYNEFDQLVSKTISPSDYQNPLDFFLDYQSVSFLSKCPNIGATFDTKKQAMIKFIQAENQCRETNERIFDSKRSSKALQPSWSVASVLFGTQQKIAEILGPVPSYSDLDFRFGPGASYGVRGDTSSYKKLMSTPECASPFTPILQEFLEEFPGWFPEGTHNVSVVPGSELTFVPKNAKTDRPICIEPMLNGLYQKGVGSYISDRLRRHGVNLRDQSINQELARLAIDESLATVDFASASDTISYAAVLDLLSIDWFEFLDVARCPSYEIEGVWYNFHKFTSMGNAYTFELESLMFYAVAVSVCSHLGIRYETGRNVSVYGDDVIIPKQAFPLFLEVSSWLGFTINTEKTFIEGVFFESCGTDWFMGRNCRPYLLKDESLDSLLSMYKITNGVLDVQAKILSLSEFGSVATIIHDLGELHAWCISRIPSRGRICVPSSLGDVGLSSDFDVALPTRHKPRDPEKDPGPWDGWTIRRLFVRGQRIKFEHSTAHALYSAMSCGLGSDIRSSEPYERRGSTFEVIRTSFVGPDWPLLPVKWNERAVRLLNR